MRTCILCGRKIQDTESCWRDHQGRYFCDDCDDMIKGKHDNIGEKDEPRENR